MKANTLRRLINLWPPFLFSGIRGTRISADFREAEVTLLPRWYNRNYVGTHFGGSLFAMTDPWYMLLLMHQLGRDYVVWDQRADIEFVSPGRGTVKARFRVSDERLEEIIEMTKDGEKHLSEFQIDVTDESSELVARVNKTVYIRRKLRKNPTEGASAVDDPRSTRRLGRPAGLELADRPNPHEPEQNPPQSGKEHKVFATQIKGER